VLTTFHLQFSAYSFSIYSSSILANLLRTSDSSPSPPLTTIFGWNTVLNLFYIPGSLLGAPLSDLLGPRIALAGGALLQAATGFAISARYADLAAPGRIAVFAIAYGIFLSLGELGPGNNIGLVASMSFATGVRGQCYGVASAMGKVGAFVGTLVFPYITAAGKRNGNSVGAAQYPFWVASGMCVLAAGFVLVGLPARIGKDTVKMEDERFRAFLEENGFDTRKMGSRKGRKERFRQGIEIWLESLPRNRTEGGSTAKEE
jgi:MFS family permease